HSFPTRRSSDLFARLLITTMDSYILSVFLSNSLRSRVTVVLGTVLLIWMLISFTAFALSIIRCYFLLLFFFQGVLSLCGFCQFRHVLFSLFNAFFSILFQLFCIFPEFTFGIGVDKPVI